MGKFVKKEVAEMSTNIAWLWQNQPPVMKWWFALSGISIMAIYFVMLAQV